MGAARVVGMLRNVRNFPMYLLHKWGLFKQEPFIIHAANNVSVEVPKRMMHTAKEVFFTDDYQLKRIAKSVLNLSESPIILDVGANVGYMSAFALSVFPLAQVISIEPIPKNLALLKRNKLRNSTKNWKLIEGVLSDKTGSTKIAFDNSDSYSTSASLHGLDHGSHSTTVASWSFKDMMKHVNQTYLHILKLDCEGSEYDILCNLDDIELRSIAFLTMETHEVNDTTANQKALVAWLTSKGWELQVVRSKVLGYNPSFSTLAATN
jgi:FkbM family methyltransferase